MRSSFQCSAWRRSKGSMLSTCSTVPSKRLRAKFFTSAWALCAGRKLATTFSGECAPTSHWKSICKANSRLLRRDAIEDGRDGLQPGEPWRALLQKGAGSFLHVCGSAAESEKSGLQKLPLFLGHLAAAIHRLHGKPHGQRAVGHDFPRERFASGQ